MAPFEQFGETERGILQELEACLHEPEAFLLALGRLREVVACSAQFRDRLCALCGQAEFACSALSLALRTGDRELEQAVLAKLLPPVLDHPQLAFLLACAAAARADKPHLLEYTRLALMLGKSAENFLTEPGFAEFWMDSDFLLLLGRPPAVVRKPGKARRGKIAKPGKPKKKAVVVKAAPKRKVARRRPTKVATKRKSTRPAAKKPARRRRD